ncbi:hypothetical protein HKD27_12495 [Gluconobacter sp. R75690]|uniref:hypothetical protein n=1 Tax=Gluconobacter TaxID=441 RepID=UPI00188C77AD|nr:MULTISPECIES: hypothetical protein [unclassified Gluconobacter]MBF0851721.1 hypothetical protein [Gluconobacter sp. R75690]MBF0880434.1 hypothetical protein [Gluconobacter sp. R75828]
MSISSATDRSRQLCVLMVEAPGMALSVEDGYRHHVTHYPAASSPVRIEISTVATSGWYDLAVRAADRTVLEWKIAGHIENGRPSITDPAIGRHNV